MDEFYTINQAAVTLKVHPLTIRRYIKEGKLKAYRVGGNIRISTNDLRSFAQNFIPGSKHIKSHSSTSDQSASKQFSFTDPILSLRGKGLSLSKLERG